eukprot:COSAG06_NODE_67984_length_244_cov_472.503448_1_plen_63_part_10
MLCCCVSCFVIRRCITLTITSYVALLRGEVTPPPQAQHSKCLTMVMVMVMVMALEGDSTCVCL